jgi:poly(hydroxyalkanoate) granule-associated protein
MVTKKPKAAKAAKSAKSTKRATNDGNLAAAVKKSAHQIWMAGLGAFGKAQDERSKVFETLVREGNAIQKRTMALTEDKMNEVSQRVSKVTDKVAQVAGQVQKEATHRWDKLEAVFEARVERALRRLGVPSTNEIRTLTKRVEQLSADVKKASGKKPPVKSAVKSAKKVVRRTTKAVQKAVDGAIGS